MNMILITLIFSALLSSTSLASSSAFSDFCVADLTRPITPSGYPCKPASNVTVDDFVFSSFVKPKIKKPFGIAFTPVSIPDLPGLNGLELSAVRIFIAKNGVVPMHTHPATELLIIVEGQVTAGFITSNGAYVKTLKTGDIMVIPKGQLHFAINSGKGSVTAFAVYSGTVSEWPLLFALLLNNQNNNNRGNLPNNLIAKTTFLDLSEIDRLGAIYGG